MRILQRILLFISFSNSVSGFELIAHRALGLGEKENTVEAVRAAQKAGVGFIEIDIRISKDHVLYVYHDHDVRKVKLNGLTFKEITELDPDIPTLRELFQIDNGSMRYLLDMKETSIEIGDTLKQEMSFSNIPYERVYIQISDYSDLTAIKNSLPHSNFIKLEKLKRKFPWFKPPKISKIIDDLKKNQINTLNIKDKDHLNQAKIRALKEAGLSVFVWTVNSPQRVKVLKKSGVDAVITDRILKFSH